MKFFGSLTLMFFISCNTNHDTKSIQQFHPIANFDSLANIEANELNNPIKFLNSDFSYQKEQANQWMIKGKISSSAAMSIYKDISFNIIFFDKTGFSLGVSKKIFTEPIDPKTSKPFELIVESPPGTDSLKIIILSATNVD